MITPTISAKNVISTFSDRNWKITIPLVAPIDFRTPISFNRFAADSNGDVDIVEACQGEQQKTIRIQVNDGCIVALGAPTKYRRVISSDRWCNVANGSKAKDEIAQSSFTASFCSFLYFAIPLATVSYSAGSSTWMKVAFTNAFQSWKS